MGVVNTTPDSFSDGGRFASPRDAAEHAATLARDGADIVDIGGESTRPGGRAISVEEECDRVLPVIHELRVRSDVAISIDTTKTAVARAACEAGACVINDISGGLFDEAMLEFADASGATFVCGHVRGHTVEEAHAAAPASFDEVVAELGARLETMSARLRERTIVDPCLGFGKNEAQNSEHLARVLELAQKLGRPVLLGPSRKRFLGAITGLAVGDRGAATVGACLAARAAGGHFFRVHDVAALRSALAVFERVREVAA